MYIGNFKMCMAFENPHYICGFMEGNAIYLFSINLIGALQSLRLSDKEMEKFGDIVEKIVSLSRPLTDTMYHVNRLHKDGFPKVAEACETIATCYLKHISLDDLEVMRIIVQETHYINK